jgi:hypothetical protein
MRRLPDDFIADCGFTIGPSADYKEDEDYVYLNSIYRSGSVVYFEFKTTEATMSSFPLTFSRTIGDEEYSLEYLDSDNPETSNDSVSDSVGSACRQPFWSGYLITGDMSTGGSVDSRLADGASIVNPLSGDTGIVERALVENLSKSIVSSFELANSDRTRVTAFGDCDPIEWDFTTGLTYEAARCIQGDVRLKAGYNIKVIVSSGSNTITLSPAAGAGDGDPCAEVALFPEESAPIGASNSLFEGGLLCNEVLRAINGIEGPDLKITGGQGVSVNPDTENNCIDIDVNLLGLDLCKYSYTSESL